MKVFAPVTGKVENLDFVSDPVFSKRMLGDGIAILPENNQIFSPVAGKIIMLFETKHALGIRSEEGSEFLLHIGIDTVELQGKPFCEAVKLDDFVQCGDLLMTVNFSYIKELNYDPTLMLIATNRKIHLFRDQGLVQAHDPVFSVL